MAKFSLKTTLLPQSTGRRRTMDGPWKNTPQEAIEAYAAKLEKNGFHRDEPIFQVFLAEECDLATAPSSDGKRGYKTAEISRTELQVLLNEADLCARTFALVTVSC